MFQPAPSRPPLEQGQGRCPAALPIPIAEGPFKVCNLGHSASHRPYLTTYRQGFCWVHVSGTAARGSRRVISPRQLSNRSLRCFRCVGFRMQRSVAKSEGTAHNARRTARIQGCSSRFLCRSAFPMLTRLCRQPYPVRPHLQSPPTDIATAASGWLSVELIDAVKGGCASLAIRVSAKLLERQRSLSAQSNRMWSNLYEPKNAGSGDFAFVGIKDRHNSPAR